MTRYFVLLLALAFSAVGWARLPEEGLVKARQAEQALASGDAQRAIALLVELDAEYPNEPAVNLRLAEIYDQEGQLGAALYYYRRYIQLAGSKARPAARERVQTLEMTAGAREAAEAVAARLGKKAKPVGTPTPKIEQAIEKVLPDGVRVRVDSPEELMSDKINPRKVVSASPTLSQHPLAQADIIIRDEEPTTETMEAAAAPRRTPVPIFTPPPITHRPMATSPEEELSPSDEPESHAAGNRAKEVKDADDAAQEHDVAPAPKVSGRAVHIELAPAEKFSTPPNSQANRAEKAATGASSQGASTAQPKTATRMDPKTFFIVHASGGPVARLSLANDISNSVLVLNALPVGGGNPVNAIVAGGETRTYEVEPARYLVHVKVMENTYPPRTLLDTRFDYEFQEGTSYARRFQRFDAGLAGTE